MLYSAVRCVQLCYLCSGWWRIQYMGSI